MSVMNDMVNDLFLIILEEAIILQQIAKRITLDSRDVMSATRLAIRTDTLRSHAVSEGVKAVTKFSSAMDRQKENAENSENDVNIELEELKDKSHSKQPPDEEFTPRKAPPRQTRSQRAGLTFPVGRIHRKMREKHPGVRMGQQVPVFLAAVLEYITAEVLELSGNAARDNKRVRIVPRHITLGVRNDAELNRLLLHCHISSGGVIPNIHASLLPKRRAH
eukprot:TRINITY_DN16450_c0_g1_i1.p1 TRINITY_DN16450_c0_g1~~TRINITY_DN16450_c0_g1_i1.p1  ORF type:complete len:243 (-),score=37.13 TRINITY_DN16450_c0_g1_i1:11-670(-)